MYVVPVPVCPSKALVGHTWKPIPCLYMFGVYMYINGVHSPSVTMYILNLNTVAVCTDSFAGCWWALMDPFLSLLLKLYHSRCTSHSSLTLGSTTNLSSRFFPIFTLYFNEFTHCSDSGGIVRVRREKATRGWSLQSSASGWFWHGLRQVATFSLYRSTLECCIVASVYGFILDEDCCQRPPRSSPCPCQEAFTRRGSCLPTSYHGKVPFSARGLRNSWWAELEFAIYKGR